MKLNIKIQKYSDYLTGIKKQDKKDMKELDKELELLASEINNKVKELAIKYYNHGENDFIDNILGFSAIDVINMSLDNKRKDK
jgi:cupin superfamily acireductone dioxygenase involved in methionine salvage